MLTMTDNMTPIPLTEAMLYRDGDYLCTVYVDMTDEDAKYDFYAMVNSMRALVNLGLSGVLRPA